MKIKKNSIDVFLIMLLMIGAIFPTAIAKQLISLSLAFLVLRIILSKDILLYVKQKIIIFLLLTPGILGSIFLAPEHTIRFSGILILALGFPFSSFKIMNSSIIVLLSLSLFYLFITQILLMQGNETILDFRELNYEYDILGAHQNYGTTESKSTNLIKNALNFKYGTVRGGGLYSNPNLLAGVVILYFFIFDITWKYLNQITNQNKKNWKTFFYWLIFLLVLHSLMQTKSKTYLIAFLVYYIFQYFDVINFLRLRFKKKFIFFLFMGVGILTLFFERFIEGILQGGSANIKYKILINYLEQASAYNIIFGGTFDLGFDTEYGYWIGAIGLSGIFAFYIFYKMVFKFSTQSRLLIFSLLIISFGASLFYNLLLVSILIPLFVLLLSSNKKINK